LSYDSFHRILRVNFPQRRHLASRPSSRKEDEQRTPRFPFRSTAFLNTWYATSTKNSKQALGPQVSCCDGFA
jgi:hypothetical protein